MTLKSWWTVTDFEDAVIIRAELKTLDDFNKLIKKLLEKRDSTYPYPQKEELK